MTALPPTSHPGDTVDIGPDGRFDIDRDLICTADSSGRFVSLNSAWEKVLGWDRHDLTVRPFIDFVHPDDRVRTQLETEKVGEVDYEIVDFENRFRTRDGRWRWLRWRARSDGEVWFAVAFDVTEAKDAVDRIMRMIQAERLLAYGQPIKPLRRSNGNHAELLARLQPLVPGGDVLLPREFIPEAERLGLIQIVDRWMTEQGLRIAEQGQCAQINVSARSLEDDDFCREIAERIGAAGGLAERVVFEITETAAVEHIDAVRDFCGRLAPLGCRFALDDFGTGYGSLTYLRALPFHYLKIDADYVQGLPGAERDGAMVRGIVAFARELGLETVAEGVEQPETLQFLREIGVDHVQGFLIGRPQPLQG